MSPKSKAADLDGSKEGEGVFGVTGGNATSALEMKESIFNEVAEFVEMPVVVALDCAIFLGRNDGIHALFSGLFKDHDWYRIHDRQADALPKFLQSGVKLVRNPPRYLT